MFLHVEKEAASPMGKLPSPNQKKKVLIVLTPANADGEGVSQDTTKISSATVMMAKTSSESGQPAAADSPADAPVQRIPSAGLSDNPRAKRSTRVSRKRPSPLQDDGGEQPDSETSPPPTKRARIGRDSGVGRAWGGSAESGPPEASKAAAKGAESTPPGKAVKAQAARTANLKRKAVTKGKENRPGLVLRAVKGGTKVHLSAVNKVQFFFFFFFFCLLIVFAGSTFFVCRHRRLWRSSRWNRYSSRGVSR
jgi:hypothetical protein